VRNRGSQLKGIGGSLLQSGVSRNLLGGIVGRIPVESVLNVKEISWFVVPGALDISEWCDQLDGSNTSALVAHSQVVTNLLAIVI